METVNNITTAASKIIWGEGQEPVSGQTGAGTVNQPYDQGNQGIVGEHAKPTAETMERFKPTGADSTADSFSNSSTSHHHGSNTGLDNTTSHHQSTSGLDSTSERGNESGTGLSNTPSHHHQSTSGVSTSADNTSAPTAPADTNPASTSTHPGQKQQGADRPEEPPNSAEEGAISSQKQAGEKAQHGTTSTKDHQSSTPQHISDEEREKLAEKGKLPHDPNDHSGEPMKMHAGGDPEKSVEGESTKAKTERSASVAHEGGGEHGKDKGTGEQWVKTSGIAAEGGDFDATKPGAGKEATRLMEEKGIKTEGATIDATTNPSTTAAEKEKVSKLAKIKEKLHIGGGKDSALESK